MLNIEKLKKLRGRQKQHEIAEILGISNNHYSQIENGKRIPSLELAIKLASYFNVPLDSILSENPTKPRPKEKERSAPGRSPGWLARLRAL